MVFVHIPFEKNIAELDVFKDRLFVAIAGILEEDTMRKMRG